MTGELQFIRGDSMIALKSIVSIAVLAVLVGCELHEKNSDESLSSGIGSVEGQSNSGNHQRADGRDGHGSVPLAESTQVGVTNQQPEESQAGWESSGIYITDGSITNEGPYLIESDGYALDVLELTNAAGVQQGAPSSP